MPRTTTSIIQLLLDRQAFALFDLKSYLIMRMALIDWSSELDLSNLARTQTTPSYFLSLLALSDLFQRQIGLLHQHGVQNLRVLKDGPHSNHPLPSSTSPPPVTESPLSQELCFLFGKTYAWALRLTVLSWARCVSLSILRSFNRQLHLLYHPLRPFDNLILLLRQRIATNS